MWNPPSIAGLPAGRQMPPTRVFLGMEEPMRMHRITIPNSKYSSISTMLHHFPPCYTPFQSSFHNYLQGGRSDGSTHLSRLGPSQRLQTGPFKDVHGRAQGRKQGRRIHLTVRTTKPWLRPVGTSGQHRDVILVLTFWK